ncbi:ComEA family DNA-binding protein [Promicromonospora sp. Marseille-Q5078]
MTTTLPHDPAGADGVSPARPEADPEPDTEPATPLDEAAARLQAWHAVREHREPPPGGGPAPGATGAPAPADADPEEDELAARLRARRSAQHVAAAYTAAHGHPLADHDGGGRRRWSLGLRAAVVAAVVVLLVAVVAAVVATARPDDVITLAGSEASPASAASGPAPSDPSSAPEPEPAASAAGVVVVHVVGEVREPGLVTVPTGARVADAVAAAGGVTKRADAAALNLARAVVDGEQIRVPRPGELPPEGDGAATPDGTTDDGVAGGADAGSADPSGGQVDLNTAATAELEELPGIGPALAGRIIAWRDENGPFTSVDELDEVSGIGPSVLEQVRDLVRL